MVGAIYPTPNPLPEFKEGASKPFTISYDPNEVPAYYLFQRKILTHRLGWCYRFNGRTTLSGGQPNKEKDETKGSQPQTRDGQLNQQP